MFLKYAAIAMLLLFKCSYANKLSKKAILILLDFFSYKGLLIIAKDLCIWNNYWQKHWQCRQYFSAANV